MSSTKITKVSVSRQSSASPTLISMESYSGVDEFELENLLKEDGFEGFDDSFEDDAVSVNFEDDTGDAGLLESELLSTTVQSKYSEALHHAAYVGNLEKIEEMYKDGADLNGKDGYGQTPLHCAILGQQLQAAKFLLDHRAKVHVLDHKQDTPIHAAVRTGNVKLFQELLVDPRLDVNIKGKEKVTPLHIAVQMDHPTTTKICQLLLNAGADLASQDINNRTPLCLAIMKGTYDVVDCLFQHAKNSKKCRLEELLYGVDQNGSTMLHLAVDTGQLKIVELCLQNGAKGDQVKESDGTTAVHMACTYGSFEILKALIKSVSYVYSYSQSDKQGLTCLHKAAMYDHVDIVRFLIDKGIELNDLDNELRTPLLLAASRGCTGAVEILLEHGADTTYRDAKNRTVLHSAVGHSETLAALLKRVAIRGMINSVDEHGSTALHYAAQGGFVKNVCLLQTRWTRTSTDYQASLLKRNNKGELPLHLAARNGWIEIVKILLQARGFYQIDAVNDFDRTPLHCAAEQGHSDIVLLLLDYQATIIKDRDGRTALHLAAAKGSLKSVAIILQVKPRCINETDKEMNTALHLAAQGGHAHIVCFLLSIKDQKVLINAYNQNVMDIAIANEHAEVAMALTEHKRWRAVLRRVTRGSEGQMQFLVRTLPHVAEKFLDKCVTTYGSSDSPHYKVTYDFRLLQGMADEDDCHRGSLDALETMVKYKRLGCLTHPLCQAFLDIKWRKAGLNEVIPQSILFFTYIVSLGIFILYQPCAISKRHPNRYPLSMNISCVKGDILYYGTWPFEIQNDGLIRLRVLYWICLSICCLRIPKEISVMRQGISRYFTDVENVFHIIALTVTLVFFLYVVPFGRPASTSGTSGYVLTVVTVIFSGVLFIKHLRNYKIFGLYVTMVIKIIKTFIKVIFLLFMFVFAFAFSFYMINVDKSQLAFRSLYQSIFTTFVWMMGEFEYKDVLVDNPPTYLPSLYYVLFVLYGICVPIIFLNLLIGLAVGDISRIQSSAELQVYAKQVERLIQIERGFPEALRMRTKVFEHTDYPNMKKSLRQKFVALLVSLVTQTRDDDRKEDTLKNKLNKHEERINEINTQLRKQTQEFSKVLQSIKHIEDYLNKTSSPPLNTATFTSL